MVITPVNLALIVLTCLISWLAFDRRKLMDRLILWPPAVSRHRQYDRLLTYGFVHADFTHLLFNMVTLLFFGGHIEREMGGRSSSVLTYLMFYLMALVVSIMPTYIKNQGNEHYLTLGASGAVSAVLFAFVLLSPWNIIVIFFIPVPAIVYVVFYVGYSVWMDARGGDNVNHSAHLSGAIFGVLFMLCMNPGYFQRFLQMLLHPRWG